MPSNTGVVGQPTETLSLAGGGRVQSLTGYGDAFSADWKWHLLQQGRIYIATDADANDAVTGQTSFADTTPSFDLEVPSGTTCLPLLVRLGQVGTVAGGAITVNCALSINAACYASGGTSKPDGMLRRCRSDRPLESPTSRHQ